VVAPMHRSWPRASIGFKRFAASIDPSVRPNQSTNHSQSCKIHLQFVLLLEWHVPNQEKTTAIKLQFCTSTGMRSSWSRKDIANQGAVCAATGMRSCWSRKRLLKSSLQFALLLEWELLDQEKIMEIKFAICTATIRMRSSWSRKFTTAIKLQFALLLEWELLYQHRFGVCCSWNEIRFLIKKRIAICATTLGQEVLDQEKTTEIKFAVSSATGMRRSWWKRKTEI
jgi:hypothetical protein